MASLNWAQVERLSEDHSADVRAETATQVATLFGVPQLTERERAMALEILELFAMDAEVQVRNAMAEHLKSCPLLPRSLALTLAADIEQVATPVLQFSDVFTEDDLTQLARAGGQGKQMAIARRNGVSELVSEVLIEIGDARVVQTLLHNETADISEPSLQQTLNRFPDRAEILNAMVQRPILPLSITCRLFQCVSEELRTQLIERHDMPPAIADELVRQGHERALAEFVTLNDSESVTAWLVSVLHRRAQLTPTLLLRTLCLGNLRFVEAAMAALAGVPLSNARTLIHDRGPLGLHALFDECRLPPHFFQAFRIAVEVYQEKKPKRTSGWTSDYVRQIIDRLLGVYETVCPEDIEHVIAQLSRQVGLESRPRTR
ncbi:MAG: DUF2336 domain-containing protein [Alphaproteobacteria bacterium]|jgi:uncharacterized protein (DUF2336 family)|nr:DUF2336 domain-containing protein [Alphaproteobacteria bacterium]